MMHAMRLYKQGKRWWVEFRDHRSIPRRISTKMLSQDQARRFAAKVARLVDAAAQGDAPPADMAEWYGSMKDYHRDKMTAWGLLDPRKMRRDGGLDPLLDEWEAHLRAKGNTDKHVRQVRRRVQELLVATGAGRWRDVTLGAVDTILNLWTQQGRTTARKGRQNELIRLSPQTRKSYTQNVKQFAKWMADFKGALDPLTNLKPPSDAKIRQGRRRVRRALSMDELSRLVMTTREQPRRWGMTGLERAYCYEVAIATGYRAAEVASLTRASFHLDADPPVVCVPAAVSKRRQDEAQPVPPALAERLRGFLACKRGDGRLFPVREYRAASMLYEDLEAAGIDKKTVAGVADFHSLRHAVTTDLLRRGVSPALVQQWARHADIRTTLSHYTRLDIADRAGALDALPDLGGSDERKEQVG